MPPILPDLYLLGGPSALYLLGGREREIRR
jgi:hypothetical protein